MVNAAGEKIPLWVIYKETMARCEGRFQSHFRHAIAANKLILYHKSSGWRDKTIETSVIDWLSKCINHRPHCLLWKVFSSHRDEDVERHASMRNTNLIFAPAGRTDKDQPLDWRIFGSLKSRSKARFEDLRIRDMN
jgi:hypothetical protein